MTSLELFPHAEHTPREPAVWGTGKMKGQESSIWTPKPPTWQYSGEPIEQLYTLTPLQLSNTRLNDQLLPNPQHADMGQMMIDLPFPAEHPYSSHISRTAVFPKFVGSGEPQFSGVKSATTPANPYDVIILSKTKGSGLRHELQALPTESEKRPLHWHSHDFDQALKYPGSEKQHYYPTPPTLINPNGEDRNDGNCLRGNMTVTSRTAEVAKNLERDQWATTYDRNYTGLGPNNPNQLDTNTGEDSALRPATTRTFNPPRPVEGRTARSLVAAPPPQTARYPQSPRDQDYKRMKTASERADDLLLNGQEYINLPEHHPFPGCGQPQWMEMQTTAHPESAIQQLAQSQMATEPTPLPYNIQTGAPDPPKTDYVENLALEQHDAHQQMEAENRWRVLESQQPHHNTMARQRKLDLVSSKQQPAVFYSHEGQFQRERSGLYNTTYDPYSLQHLMNKDEKTGARLMDFSDYHKNSLDLPTALNVDMAEAIRYNRTLGNPGSVAQLNDQPSLYEAIGPFDKAKALQKAQLQPNVRTADGLTQERDFISTESTQADSYNTKKFLQENSLPGHVRNEPLQVMSNENQNLANVRLTTIPKPTAGRPMKVPDDILTGDPIPGSKWLSKSVDFSALRPNSSPELSARYSYSAGLDASKPGETQSLPHSLERSKIQSRYGVNDQFLSKSTNFIPSASGSSWFAQSAYQSQFPTANNPLTDLSFKNDSRFQWKSGSGTPRPQTKLLDIQNGFVKSEARKKFHQQFPENGVDIRDNITLGKKHTFSGVNAQILRGTPIVG